MVDYRSNGFALAVTLLVLAVAIGAFVTAASVSMIGARRGASGERSAYQALRVAENAVNTFPTRLLSAEYNGAFDAAEINAWIAADDDRGALLTYDEMGGTGQAELEVLPAAGASTIVVRAVSAVPGASKTVLRDVQRQLDRQLSPPSLTAPLLSVPPADIRGAAVIRGVDYLEDDVDGSVAIGPVSGVSGPEGGVYTVTNPRAFLARPGFYVAIGGSRFRVLDVPDASTMNLEQVYPDPSVAGSVVDAADLEGAAASVIPAAVAATLSATVLNPATISLSYDSALREGTCVRLDLGFAGDDEVYTAEVTDIGGEGRTAQLDFTSSACRGGNSVPVAGIPESTALITDIVSAESAGIITSPGGGQDRLPNGTTTGEDSWLYEFRELEDRERLFEATFGLTRQEFRQLAADAPQPGNGGVISKALKDIRYDGLTYSTGGAENKAFCGSGFMVIEGDVSFTAGQPAYQDDCAGEEGFSGIVYITGDFRHQGNSVFIGSVVVEGTTYIDEEPVEVGDDTFVGGTGQSLDKIRYDLAAILEASSLIRVPGGVTWVMGTWRQE